MEKSSIIGLKILENLGFDFPNGKEEIPTGDKESADFLVSYDGEKAIVEVKLKIADKEKQEEREKCLDSGNIYIDESENTNTSINNIVRKSNHQLRKSSENILASFKILLFIPISYNADINRQQLINTLYGKVEVIDFESKEFYPCYSYNYSDFLRRESIDCVIIAEIKNYTKSIDVNNFNIHDFRIYFCLNPYSNQYSKISKSGFIRYDFAQIIDPTAELNTGKAFVLEDLDWEKIKESGQDYEKFENAGIMRMSKRVQILSKKYQKDLIPMNNQTLPKISIRF